MKKRSLKISIIATPMMIVCGLMASGGSAWAERGSAACSNQTLSGNYGFSIEGVVILPTGATVPLRGVALTHFDGRGNLSQVDHVVFNGGPPAEDWTPGIGTYTVNSDCTGSLHIDIPSTNDFLNLRFVIGNGKEIRTVVTAPFSGPARTVTSVGTKID